MTKGNNKKKLSLGYGFLLVLFVYYILGVIPQILKSQTKIEKIKEEMVYLESKNKMELEKIKKYTENIEQLDNEFERERIARNRLQMLKPDEVIYRLNQTKQEEQ